MGLDVSLRLKNRHTGELKDLEDFRGRDFTFVKEFVNSQDLYGQYITLSPEEIEILPISSTKKHNIQELLEKIVSYLW